MSYKSNRVTMELKVLSPTAVWLAHARATNDPEGDLIADMRRELQAGIDIPLFPNKQAMQTYLRSKGACPEALAAIPGVWRRYRRWLDQHGTTWAQM